jgi:hypothetical protein
MLNTSTSEMRTRETTALRPSLVVWQWHLIFPHLVDSPLNSPALSPLATTFLTTLTASTPEMLVVEHGEVMAATVTEVEEEEEEVVEDQRDHHLLLEGRHPKDVGFPTTISRLLSPVTQSQTMRVSLRKSSPEMLNPRLKPVEVEEVEEVVEGHQVDQVLEERHLHHHHSDAVSTTTTTRCSWLVTPNLTTALRTSSPEMQGQSSTDVTTVEVVAVEEVVEEVLPQKFRPRRNAISWKRS